MWLSDDIRQPHGHVDYPPLKQEQKKMTKKKVPKWLLYSLMVKKPSYVLHAAWLVDGTAYLYHEDQINVTSINRQCTIFVGTDGPPGGLFRGLAGPLLRAIGISWGGGPAGPRGSLPGGSFVPMDVEYWRWLLVTFMWFSIKFSEKKSSKIQNNKILI